MRIVLGTDESTAVTESLAAHLRDGGHDVDELAVDRWGLVGRRVGEAVAAGEADVGVVCCWTGTGVSIAANKVPGVRAALCTDAATAAGARRWNDANVLALGLRLSTEALAKEIVDGFLATDEVDDEERLSIDGLEVGLDDS